MRQRLFVYGTLLDEDILRKVIGCVPPGERATLKGYRRVRMFDRPWPVIRPAPNAKVSGRILGRLSHRQMRQIDHYEGKEYRRKRVRVCLPNGSHHIAWTYVGAARSGESWPGDSIEQHQRRWHTLLSSLRR